MKPTIRRATPDDAADIVGVLSIVAAERVHSAISDVWTVEQERQFIASLSPREALHVAVDPDGRIGGLQILDRWSAYLGSMSHVAQVGTFLLPEWRKRGIGRELWDATLAFARTAQYRKLVIQVRASNTRAQAYYRRLGFAECGRLTKQVIIDGVEDDEVIMEMML